MDSNTELKYQLVFDLNKRHEAHLETLDSLFKGTTNTQTDNATSPKDEDLFPVFFQEKYKDVFDTLEYIVKRKKGKDTSGKFDDYIHNVILISGSRGSGKTSMLHSIGKHLETKGVSGQKFTCLPPIDPSYFDQNRNILKSVLSKMFKMAKDKFNETSCNEADFTDLWKDFERVYKTLEYVDGAKKECYTLEALNESSDASDLRDQVQKLITSFLKALRESDNFLVLLIDDLDMNVSFAAEMMEQIRKFLMVNNLIILVSANLEQLQSEMREYYSKEFQNVVKNHDLNIDIDDLVDKYLLKMFPPKRRIELDDNKKKLLQTALILEDSSRKDNEERFQQYNGSKNNRNPLQNVLLTMLWNKTRLLFIPKKEQLHPLIPTTMRELFQFIAVLADMKEVEAPKNGNLFNSQDNYENIKKNLAIFKSYFLNIWVSHHVSEDGKLFILNMPQDIEEVNKYLIQAINQIGVKNKAKQGISTKDDTTHYAMVLPDDNFSKTADKISYIGNFPSNVSYGDLLSIIHKYENYFVSPQDRNFTYAIKILYSILLVETAIIPIHNQNDIHPIQILIGGTLYQPHYFILSKIWDTETQNILNKLKINISNCPHYHSLQKDDPLYNSYFILYFGEHRPNRYDSIHTYDSMPKKGPKPPARFDILAPILNILNPTQSNKRLSIKPENNEISLWETNLCSYSDDKNTHQFANTILPIFSVELTMEYLTQSIFIDDYLSPDAKKGIDNFALLLGEFSLSTQESIEKLNIELQKKEITKNLIDKRLSDLSKRKEDSFFKHLSNLSEIQNLEKYISALDEKITNLSSKKIALDIKLSSTSAENENSRKIKTITNLQPKGSTTSVELAKINAEIEDLTKEKKERTAALTKLTKQNSDLEALITNCTFQLTDEKSENEKLITEIDELVKKKSDAEKSGYNALKKKYLDITENVFKEFRSREHLFKYYQEYLWDEITVEALGRIAINDTIKKTYKKIFDAGMEVVFRKEEHKKYREKDQNSTSSNN